MLGTTEILSNVIAIAEMLWSRDALPPDVPYLELAKCVRLSADVEVGHAAQALHAPLVTKMCEIPALETMGNLLKMQPRRSWEHSL